MQVQALATVSSGMQRVHQVDVTAIATLTSSSALLAVSSDGQVAVASAPEGQASSARISVLEHVTGAGVQVHPLQVDVVSAEVCSKCCAGVWATLHSTVQCAVQPSVV